MARSVPSRAGARRPAPAKKRSASRPVPSGRRRSTAARRRAAAVRARRLRSALIVAIVTIAIVTVAGIAAVFTVVGSAARGFGDCASFALAPGGAPASVSQWNTEQLDNAAVIMGAGSDLGLSARDQAIGVMTAMGESSLRNLDHGDWETSGATNPDGSRTTSVGLFQQQDSWGSREQRMDPYTAATLFYRAMAKAVPDAERPALAPTLVAHRTQVNADPQHYARYWPAAVGVVEKLSGVDTGLSDADRLRECR
ncbi:peptidase M23 [Microbacterium sp. LWS13-1.2]|uniref:Peptidase M23 n=1 Tax=Microbacterium sp. LWS13-1.2 TaxID=3135264 RepID=A0AAU6SCX7_9MICO